MIRLKTFEKLWALEEVKPAEFDELVNVWLAEHSRNIHIVFRDFHTRSGLNVSNHPYTYYTLMVWYIEHGS